MTQTFLDGFCKILMILPSIVKPFRGSWTAFRVSFVIKNVFFILQNITFLVIMCIFICLRAACSCTLKLSYMF